MRPLAGTRLRCGAWVIGCLLALPAARSLAATRVRSAAIAPLVALGIGDDEAAAVDQRLRRAAATCRTALARAAAPAATPGG